MRKIIGLSLVLIVLTACSTEQAKRVEANKSAKVAVSQPAQKKRVAGYVKTLPQSGTTAKSRTAAKSNSKSGGEGNQGETAKKSGKQPPIKLAQAELTVQNVQSANCKDIFEAMAYFYVATKMTKTSAPNESVAHEKRYRQLKTSYDKKCP